MKDNTESEKESLPNGDESDLLTKEKEDSITCCSWKFAKLLYSASVTAVLSSSYGQALAFSSPLLDEMIRDANSTPWIEWTDNCLYQSLIAWTLCLNRRCYWRYFQFSPHQYTWSSVIHGAGCCNVCCWLEHDWC